MWIAVLLISFENLHFTNLFRLEILIFNQTINKPILIHSIVTF